MATALVTQIAYAVQTLFDPAGTAGRLVDLGKLANYGLLTSFTPAYLFTTGVNGVWYDPSDITRYMSSLGPELVTNGDFSNGAAGWAINTNGTATVSSGVLTLTNGSVGFQRIAQGLATTVGKTYRINCTNLSGNSRYSVSSANDYGQNVLAVQSVSGAVFTATTTTSYIVLSCYTATNGDTATFDNISVRELTDISTATMFQDAAGTTPVTAMEQPVGLMLDKSKGLVLGPELVTNGGFSSNLSSWAQSTANYWTWVNGRAYHASSANYNELSQTFAVISRPVRIEFDYECLTASNTAQWFYTNAAGVVKSFDSAGIPRLQNGVGKMIYTAIDGIQKIGFARYSQAEFYIDNISVRELPGNHAFNSSGNSANFPVLSARYNLLTKSEDFTAGGPWTLGTGVSVSNQKTITFTSGGATEFVRQLYSFVSGITYTILIRAKSVSGNTTMSVDLENAQGVTDMILTTEFQVFQRQITPSAARAWMDIQLGGGGVVQIDYIDLRVANDALNQPTYQRVNTATDYDPVGFKPYLKFNGTNQWLQTNNIDFTYGDKMFVCAGVRKLSDAARGMVAELGANPGVSTFQLNAPLTVGDGSYSFGSSGSALSTINRIGFASPISSVVSGIGNISGDLSTIRINGDAGISNTSDQGTGNYGNYPLYIGARAGTSLWFNGRLHQLVVVGKQASDSEIGQTEAFTNQKTGAY